MCQPGSHGVGIALQVSIIMAIYDFRLRHGALSIKVLNTSIAPQNGHGQSCSTAVIWTTQPPKPGILLVSYDGTDRHTDGFHEGADIYKAQLP